MNMSYIKVARLTLILVYLVIAAGAIVRMTGSGMGCPDWPKCFGYVIPPTEESQLMWTPGQSYSKGQAIIWEETLLMANSDFTSAQQFEMTNWMAYEKHDYATFNVFHTWTEYINRLLGALAGLSTLVLALVSLKFMRSRPKITILSFLALFAMGFQGWLGAIVVYSVLAPVKITIHMVMAFAIVALLLYLIYLTTSPVTEHKKNKTVRTLVLVALIMTLVQVVLGTQVREFIDTQIKTLGDKSTEQWLTDPEITFYIHRSFSIGVVAINLYIFYLIRKLSLGFRKIRWVLGLLLLEIISGIAMNYFEFPFGSQAIHLLMAAFLFGVQFYLFLEVNSSRKAMISS
ncbi:MAG: COX15/CtaA family protein [Bacteroidia bacterium]|nr:COX15/CtaA family protein [Bacteroidia bacterium]